MDDPPARLEKADLLVELFQEALIFHNICLLRIAGFREKSK
jgi:hypothetical protein